MRPYLQRVEGLYCGTLCTPPNDAESAWFASEEDELIRLLERTTRLVRKLLKAGQCHSCNPGDRTNTTKVNRRRMLDVLRLNFEEVHRHFPMHRLAPELALIERLGTAWEAQGLVPRHMDGISARMALPPDQLDALVQDMLLHADSEDFAAAQKNFKRKFTKNHSGLLKNLTYISRKCARILAIRLDFSYRKPDEWPTDTRSPVNLAEAVLHRRKILAWIKKEYAVVGYAWRLEHGLVKGYHYHVLLLLDGSRHQRDVSIAKRIGEHWNRHITEGKGLHWNCNADQYHTRGVGMLDYRDTSQIRTFLEHVVPYLTKTDEVFEFAPPGGVRTFGRSATITQTGRKQGRRRGSQSLLTQA